MILAFFHLLPAEVWAAIAHWIIALTAVGSVILYFRTNRNEREKLYLEKLKHLENYTDYLRFHQLIMFGFIDFIHNDVDGALKMPNEIINKYIKNCDDVLPLLIPYDIDKTPIVTFVKSNLEKLKLAQDIQYREILINEIIETLQNSLKL